MQKLTSFKHIPDLEKYKINEKTKARIIETVTKNIEKQKEQTQKEKQNPQ